MYNKMTVVAVLAIFVVGSGWLFAGEKTDSTMENATVIKTLACVGFDAPLGIGPVMVPGKVAMPIKAQLIDSNGSPVDAYDLVTAPVLQIDFRSAIRMDAVDVSDLILAKKLPGKGNRFGYEGERWQINLRLSDYSAPGTYQVRLLSGDPQEYSIGQGCEALFVIR